MRAVEFLAESYDRSVFRMAKLQKDGRIVRILKHADQVGFSDDRGWLLIDTTPGRAQPETMKWIPDTTAFDWVREYNSADYVNEESDLKTYTEIAKIPSGDFGTAGTIGASIPDVERKELPGGSGLTYGVNRENDLIEIMIIDDNKIVGELDIVYTRGPAKTWEVDSVAVDPEHRGRGIAKALYGIALSILRLPIEAGQLQTAQGQKMWLMLNSLPGVEVVGYNHEPTQQYRAQPGDEIIKKYKDRIHYTFPVEAGKRSMRSRRQQTDIYSGASVTMIAQWRGQ